MVKLVAQCFCVVAYATELTWLVSTSDTRTLAYVHLMLSNDLPTLFSFQRFYCRCDDLLILTDSFCLVNNFLKIIFKKY